MFSKILVANRGIIRAACIQAAKELGATAATFFVGHDNKSIGLRSADEVHTLETSEVSRAYYDAEAIANLAAAIGADAVHPGYGFLAEDLHFAQMLEDRGITLIAGSLSGNLSGLADKTIQKKWATDLGIPTVPGSSTLKSAEEIIAAARSLVFPLVLKPVSAAGGLGIEVFHKRAELENSISPSTRSDSRPPDTRGAVYLESWLESARHIEFPVIRDKRGRVVVFPELECTLQRRFQKLVIESPAFGLPRDLIHDLSTLSRRLVEQHEIVGLVSVEFLIVDNDPYFLEINSYIPPSLWTTYHLTGVDLLQEQIRVFAGESVSVSQAEVQPRGHVIAAQLNAEDPRKMFQPSPGNLEYFSWLPALGVNVYSTSQAGDALSTFYDALIAQFVVTATTRDEAIKKLLVGLADTRILGVRTNISFLRALFDTPLFRKCEFTVASLLREDLVEDLCDKTLANAREVSTAALVASLALHNDSNSREILQAAEQNSRNSFWGFTSRWLNRNKMEF